MKINQEKLYWHFKNNSWYIPVLIATVATPFMIIAITTKDPNLEMSVKIIWLLLSSLLLGYNFLLRSLRKKFEPRGK